MDYFGVIILIIVIFMFAGDRTIKNIDEIKEQNHSIYMETNIVKDKMSIIKTKDKDMNYNKILKLAQNIKSEYILFVNAKLNLSDIDIETLVANYINSNSKPCGVNLIYTYRSAKWSFKKIYVDIINYLNIFNKNELSTYGVIICKMDDLLVNEKKFKQKLISYAPIKGIEIEFKEQQLRKQNLKKIYINKISNANTLMLLKLLLLIASSSIITTNLIYAIVNINSNVNGAIIAGAIYYCYSYVIRHIYKPMGKHRAVATYIFPIYFLTYIAIAIYYKFIKSIKNVHAS